MKSRRSRTNKNVARIVASIDRQFNSVVAEAMGVSFNLLSDDMVISGEDKTNVVSTLEDEFNLEFADEDYANVETIGDARSLIMDLMLQKAVET